MKTVPFFEINGERYEIKKTRHLLVEYDKKRENNHNVSAEDKQAMLELQKVTEELKKYAEKLKELEEKFFETLDAEDERKYRMMKRLYDDTYSKFTQLMAGDALNNSHKANLNLLQDVVICGLAEQYFNSNIGLAREKWDMYCESVTSDRLIDQWLLAFGEYLTEDEETEVEGDNFLSRLKAEREQQELNRRNGTRQ